MLKLVIHPKMELSGFMFIEAVYTFSGLSTIINSTILTRAVKKLTFLTKNSKKLKKLKLR